MSQSPFSLDHSPLIGVAEPLGPDLAVVTAPNASPMTFTGTRTYLLGGQHLALIDPGPLSQDHKRALLSVLEGRHLEAIFVTHAHLDHSPLAADLSELTGAPVYGCAPDLAKPAEILLELGSIGGGEGIDTAFRADIPLADGEKVTGTGWQLEAIHTPGHLSDHLCFSDGARLFSGDHVMGWASSMISPPEGNLTAFMSSLQVLLEREEEAYFPGHGPPVKEGRKVARYLLEHRRAREAQLLAQLEAGADTVSGLTSAIYRDVDPSLHRAASRNVLSHLIDLYGRGIVTCGGVFEANGVFALARK